MPSNHPRLPYTWPQAIEWPTLLLLVACLGGWVIALFWVAPVSLFGAGLIVTFTLVLHSSLTHEVLHGHPFPNRWASEALVLINPGLFIPYLRFRDQHLAHHQDSRLTDPYDDPETNYVDPMVWNRLPRAWRSVLRMNNTLAGRMVVGPLVGQFMFMKNDLCEALKLDAQVIKGWALHVPGVILVLWVVLQSETPVWLYLVSAYAALSILKIRTFLEHQAHELARGRTVIVEDRGILALLFLNNNLHVVHHMHPRVPWYRLPALYAANKGRYLRRNEGYLYHGYREVFARHFLRSKDPVPHPLWPSAE
ncbi:MAG: fatty acid desaturase [Rhodobacteraceae bacterium]|nr:fatty acid desaturase [Paracoccaceae bacterium]